jgi:hypothetical protein
VLFHVQFMFFYLILNTENFNIVHFNNEPILKAFSTLQLRKLLYIGNELNYIFNCVSFDTLLANLSSTAQNEFTKQLSAECESPETRKCFNRYKLEQEDKLNCSNDIAV